MRKTTHKTIFFILALLASASIILYTGCSKDDKSETCDDGIQNQGETGVDCGGPCEACATCSDGIQNQGETGIDCGGPCSPCPPSARDSVVIDYNTNYLGSAVSDPGWTGDESICNAGSISQATQDAVIKRVNYFRRMVGLNECTMDASLFPMCQETALIMHANNQLSHNPPPAWFCWTQDGHDYATSNLALGTHSANAVTLMIQDPGATNTACGHRRWILHSAKTKFSHGSTTNAMALYVFIPGSNTQIPEFIAWPPARYVPQQLVFSRWSFGKPGSNFSAATVSMTGPSGGNVPLTIVSTAVGYGDPTIVWEPVGIITNDTIDVTYTVTVSGITGAGDASYTYDVIIIKP